MTWAVALAVWVTVAAGAYLLLSRDTLRVVFGLAVLGSAVNLVVLASGRLGSPQPPIVPRGGTALAAGAANPLPQALVLTAVVIGFALVCFALVLALRLIRAVDSDDVLALRAAEPAPDDPVKPPLTDADTDIRMDTAATRGGLR
jgi:multicomponent Na+:H+ antiporter subunit C